MSIRVKLTPMHSVTEETRREAYYSSKSLAITRRKIIYSALRKYGPLAVDELMDKLGYNDPNQVRPRLTELKKDGLVETCGKRTSKRTGRTTAVWQVAEIEKAAPDAGTSENGKEN